MEFVFIAIVILIGVVVINGLKSHVKFLAGIIDSLAADVRDLTKEIKDLKEARPATTDKPKDTQQNPVAFQPAPQPATAATPEAPQDEEVIYLRPKATISPTPQELTGPGPIFIDEQLATPQPIAAFSEPAYSKEHIEEQETPAESWLSKNPDLEKFIGENLINKIGIAVLVLGIAFFVKYAIDQDWINEAGRVCIGMGCGALLVGIAHYMRNNYRSFSSVLAGGGIAVFYFTIAFAFHQYHLMSQTAAFIIMVIITAFAVALSVLYNKLELAVIAAVGGFIAPFLVATGDGNYIVLFTYLTILNIGLLSLSWFKRWPALNIIALFFTEVIYAAWLADTIIGNKHVSYPAALLFASIFYFIFLGMNMLHQLRNKLQFKAFDFFILLFISCSYYAAGMALLHLWNGGAYQGLFTLSIGLINLLLAYYIFKTGRADRNLLYLLIGLTFTFVTLTIPIQLHGHAITMFWSAEFVLLYWLSVYSGIRIFRQSSALLCVLTIISLVIDWSHALAATGSSLALIFSNLTGIVTNLVAVAAFACYAILLRKSKDVMYLGGIRANEVQATALIAGTAILYLTCYFGVNLYFNHLTVYDIPNVYHRIITEIFGLALLMLMQKRTIRATPIFQFVILVACFIFYVVSNYFITNLFHGVLAGHYPFYHLWFHWLASVLMVALCYKIIQGIRQNMDVFGGAIKGIIVGICIMAIAFLSIEILQLYVLISYRGNNTSDLTLQYGKAGLSALWGLCSFALMWLGMKHGQKTLRIVSLCLFSIVLLKLFIFDISGISEGGKIFAFILLGVLLLTVSFMYQKLKKIIIDDHKE